MKILLGLLGCSVVAWALIHAVQALNEEAAEHQAYLRHCYDLGSRAEAGAWPSSSTTIYTYKCRGLIEETTRKVNPQDWDGDSEVD